MIDRLLLVQGLLSGHKEYEIVKQQQRLHRRWQCSKKKRGLQAIVFKMVKAKIININ